VQANIALEPTPASVRCYLGLPLPCCFHVYGYRLLSRHTLSGPNLAPNRAQKRSPSINVQLVRIKEVFGQRTNGRAS
jgi:hypothetical protein